MFKGRGKHLRRGFGTIRASRRECRQDAVDAVSVQRLPLHTILARREDVPKGTLERRNAHPRIEQTMPLYQMLRIGSTCPPCEVEPEFSTAKYIVLLPPMYNDLETGEIAMNPNLSDEEWAKYAGNVQKVADHVARCGLTGTFHPHVDSYVQTEDQIERLLKDTTVLLCFDTGHHVYGGGEPIAFFKEALINSATPS